jgi:hypothetical protein
VETVPTIGMNYLSSVEEHFMDTCCFILGLEYRDTVDQMGSEPVDIGGGDPVKTIKEIRCLLVSWRSSVAEWRTTGGSPRAQPGNSTF